MSKISSLRKDFSSPDKSFRLAPFWFWNDKLDNEELKSQISQMKQQGVGGFVMHARHGLLTPYMSEEWLKCIGTAVKEAERLGMWAWLYDEYNWPSGTAGGRVTEEYPEYRMSQLYVAKEINLAGPLQWRRKLNIEDEVKFIYAVQTGGNRLKGVPGGVVDLSRFLKGESIEWQVPRGSWKVIIIARNVFKGTFFGYYLDLLNKNAVKKFIEYTHKIYINRFSKYLGKVIPGTFFDEPGMQFTSVKRSIPWTAGILRKFSSVHGYGLGKRILGLFYEIGQETGRVRCDYYEVATRLYVNAFFKQIYDYCEKNKILSIGHVVWEGELFENVRKQGDFFRTAEYMHWAGVDNLDHQTLPDNNVPNKMGLCNLVASKMASSSAHLCNKPRTMSEAFGVADGWKMNLRTLKLLADWQVVLGINYFIPHAFYYSIKGFRKWECAPDEFFHTTYWKYYKIFADYMARLCYLFTGASHVADVAVFYPARSIWAERNPDSNPITMAIQKNFESLSTTLMKLHRDFDYITEEMIQTAEVERGQIKIRDKKGKETETFKILILPSVTTLSRKTLKNIKKFCDEGGHTLITNYIPSQSSEQGKDLIIDRFFRNLIKEKNNVVYLNETVSGNIMNRLIKYFDKMIEPDVTISCKRQNADRIVYCHYRRHDSEEDIYFLSNTSEEKKYKADIAIKAKGILRYADAVSGKITLFGNYRERYEKTHLQLEFEPTQSHIIMVSKTERLKSVSVPRLSLHKGDAISLPDEWNFKTEKMNALPLTEWNLKMGSTKWYGIRTFRSEFWVSKIPRKAKLITDSLLAEPTKNRFAVKPAEVWINGKRIIYFKGQQNTGFRKSRYINHSFREVNIEKFLKKGRNEISVETHGGAFEPAQIGEMVVIVGTFALSKKQGRFFIDAENGKLRTGSWSEQGYPFYSGTGIYQQEISVSKLGIQQILYLKKVADLADIWVNGRQVMVLPWEPFKADVTGYLKTGNNKITIKVVNSLQNLFHKEARPSGLLKGAEIIIKDRVVH